MKNIYTIIAALFALATAVPALAQDGYRWEVPASLTSIGGNGHTHIFPSFYGDGDGQVDALLTAGGEYPWYSQLPYDGELIEALPTVASIASVSTSSNTIYLDRDAIRDHVQRVADEPAHRTPALVVAFRADGARCFLWAGESFRMPSVILFPRAAERIRIIGYFGGGQHEPKPAIKLELVRTGDWTFEARSR
ncbi:MAG: hypothetical protein HY461_02700 [Parcubacteria group bacterium]|nr:hypothetical protein [Parcubacteria group bacterium]